MKTPTHPRPTAAALLSLADTILGHARRLENLASWRTRLDRHLSLIQAGESLQGADYFLRLVQARRDSGDDVPDVALFRIAWIGKSWADEPFLTDAKLSELDDHMDKIREREDADWDFDDPDAPEDFKRMATRWSCRFAEVEQVCENRFVRFLLAHGETDMAEIYQRDRAAFDLRCEAGRFLVFGPQPVIKASTGGGDMGVTQQVATGQK